MTRKMIRYAILYTCLIFIASAANDSKLLSQTLTNQETVIPGEIIAEITDGDFVHPKLSPDGAYIACSRVIIEKAAGEQHENTEILIFDLRRKTKHTLLNANQARKYAVYASFVYNIEWLGNGKLRAYISDGDVDSIEITFDTIRKVITKVRHLDPEWNEGAESKRLLPIQKKLAAVFASVPEDVFNSALTNSPLIIGEDRVVAQYRYSKYDDSIRLFDLTNRKETILLEAPNSPVNTFLGGFVSGENLVFGLGSETKTDVYLYRNNRTKLLVSRPFEENYTASLESKLTSPDKFMFMIQSKSDDKQFSSTLWLYENDVLTRVSNYKNLYDFDTNDTSKLAAFCYWQNGKRHLSVIKTRH